MHVQYNTHAMALQAFQRCIVAAWEALVLSVCFGVIKGVVSLSLSLSLSPTNMETCTPSDGLSSPDVQD